MNKPLVAKIDYQHFCFCSDVAERYPEIKIQYLAELGSSPKAISHLFRINGNEMPAFLEAVKKHPITIKIEIIRRGENSVDMISWSKEDASTAHALKEAGCALIANPIYDAGIERAHVFAPSFESLRQFIDGMQNTHTLQIKSKHYIKENEHLAFENANRSKYLELAEATELLPKRQTEALKLASRYGYFEVPKRCSLSAIGEKMGISDAAAGELLRKAQKRLLPVIAKIVEAQE